MIFDMWFFILAPYSFQTLPVKQLQLCFYFTDLLRIAHPLIWYDLFFYIG